MVSEVIADYITHYPKDKATKRKKVIACLSKFIPIVGDRDIRQLKQRDLRDFLDIVQRLPSARGGKQRPEGVPLRDLAGGDVVMAPRTFENNYLSPVRLFLSWARGNYLDEGFPPALTVDGITYRGSRQEGEEKQRAFKPHELERLFLGPEMGKIAGEPKTQSHYWLPLLGLFTGARINELCQVNPAEDIEEVAGVLRLTLTTESEPGEDIAKSIKTGTPRTIPIHPKLIELGFKVLLRVEN